MYVFLVVLKVTTSVFVVNYFLELVTATNFILFLLSLLKHD